MQIDFHAHFDIATPDKIKTFIANCEKNSCLAAMSGGLRYGSDNYLSNEQVLDLCSQYNEYLIPMVKMDLWDQVIDLSELRRFVDKGAKGVKCIYPYYPYDHDLYMPLYEECEKLALPILFHTGNYRPNAEDMISRRPILKNMDPINLDRVARSFQSLPIVIAHLGTTFWRVQAAELIKMHSNVYADLGGCGSWQALSAEKLVELLAPAIFLCKDTDRFFYKLVFGSDCYVSNPHVQTRAKLHYKQILNKIGASDELHQAVMGKTVKAWLMKKC
jgi:predicted TIM-barrel fold metal-dependent hydrolase